MEPTELGWNSSPRARAIGARSCTAAFFPDRFITVDRWTDEVSWHTFQNRFRTAYLTLDTRTNHLTVDERALLEGEG